MKYLKLYEQFRLLLEKLDHKDKKLFLLCYFKSGGIQGDKDKSIVFNSRSGEKLSL
jgi:hypothetical protein